MKIVDIEQGTQAWHDFRKQGIGSSDITILLGSYPFGGNTPLKLFEDKTSDLVNHDDNEAMAYGRAEEPKALAELLKMDSTLRPACAIHQEYDFVRCSFDALGNDSFYEIKCPKSLKVLEQALMGDLQPYWKDQARWQMLISGFQKGHVAVWDGSKPHIFEIEKDEEWESNAIKVAQEFWSNVMIGQRPEATDEDYIEVEDQDASICLQEYYRLCEEEKELKKHKDAVKAQILDKGPGHNFTVDGIKIYQMQNTSYDFSKMRADGIKVDLYKKSSHPYWMIAPKKGSSKVR